MSDVIEHLKTLTSDDLKHWAGDKIYDRGKGMVKAVSGLSLSTKDELTAKVKGTQSYSTSVYLHDGKFTSFCTCPYNDYGQCKHAVAVIFAAIEQINSGKDILSSSSKDALVKTASSNNVDQSKKTESKKAVNKLIPAEDELMQLLSKQPKGTLISQLLRVAEVCPETKNLIASIGKSPAKQINIKQQVTSLRNKIKKITTERSWQNYWDRTGHTPNYQPIINGLEKLLKHGAFDEVVALGAELWSLGLAQIELSDDEGELAYQLTHSMLPVLEALPKTNMEPVAQLLWLIDRELEDDYQLLTDNDLVYDHESYSAAYWQGVAVILNQRLKFFTAGQKLDFEYKKVIAMLAFVYQKAGDENSMLTLLEKQVRYTHDYVELVDAFIQQGNQLKAKQWCLKGFELTLKDKPGIAAKLKQRLQEWSATNGDMAQVAALCADDFLSSPSMKSFQALQHMFQDEKHTVLNGKWSSVRATLLNFIEHVEQANWFFPVDWLLPAPEVSGLSRVSDSRFRQTQVEELLIEIAIYEENYDEAVDRFGNREGYQIMTDHIARSLALAVSKSHPETAIDIWKACALAEIGLTNVEAYRKAGDHLRKLRMVYEKHERLDEWKNYIKVLQVEHKRKIRLQEVLEILLNSTGHLKLIH